MKGKETTLVYETVMSFLNKMADSDDLDGEILPENWLSKDLGFESIDIVILGSTLQQHYNRTFPFAAFLMEIGKREPRDIRVSEFVDFVEQHLQNTSDI